MGSPLKRRKISADKSIDISPIKVNAANIISSKSNGHANGTGAILGSNSSGDRTVTKPLPPVGLEQARRAPSTMTTKTSAGRASRALAMDGTTDEDIFDAKHVGREPRLRRNGHSPRSLASRGASRNNANMSSKRGRPSARSSVNSASPAAASPNSAGVRVSTKNPTSDTNVGKGKQKEKVRLNELAIEDKENRQTSGQGTTEAPEVRGKPGNELGNGQNRETQEEEVEPELPKLPARLGLEEMPTPPHQGLLSSSPSGRKLERLNRQRSTHASSRLAKRHGLASRDDSADQEESRTEQPGREVGKVEEGKAEAKDTEEVEQEQEQESDIPGISIQPSGPIITWDLGIEKKQNEYEALLREKAKLEAEVSILEDSLPSRTKVGGLPDDDALLQVLLSAAETGEKAKSTTPTHDRLATFLPFSTQATNRTRQESPSPTTKAPSSPTPNADQSVALLSHLAPLKVTVKTLELPHSSFKPDVERMQLVYHYNLRSPDDVLSVNIKLATLAVKGTVATLKTSSVSPWAVPELAKPFISRFERSGDGSGGSGDVNTLAHGLATFWELDCLRARTWETIIADHAELVHAVDEGDGIQKLAKSIVSSRKDRDEDDSDPSSKQSRELRSQLAGQRHLRLQKDNVAVLFSWHIKLDWTGEASSHLDACIACPDSWRRGHGQDQNEEAKQALDNIGELFHLLVRRQGVRKAVSAIVDVVLLGGRPDRNNNERSTSSLSQAKNRVGARQKKPPPVEEDEDEEMQVDYGDGEDDEEEEE